MSLIVNGEPAPIAAPATIADLLAALDAPPRGLAVAVNAEVIPRGSWPVHELRDGDRVEVVTAVQGG